MDNGAANRSTSIVSQNIQLDGEVHGKENLSIQGFVKGVLKLEGNLKVEETGVVEADIEAENVIVKGTVSGNVTARRQLEIRGSGKLMGVIRAASIDIQEGAIFEGRSHMIPKSGPDNGEEIPEE